jgi:DUF2993 family protein
MRKALLVLLILVVGGLIAADRIGVRIVEDQIAEQVAAEYELNRRPEVTIHGVPFLTQAVRGRYDRIDVAMSEYTQKDVTLRDVKIDMRGVRAPLSEVANGNTSNVTARTATASAILPFQLLQKYAPKEIRRISARGKDVQVDLTGALLGVPLSGTAIVAVQVGDQGVQVVPQSIGTGGLQVPLDAVRDQLTWTVPVQDLPVGSRISKVEVTSAGVRVTAAAENVHLDKLPQS